MFLSVSQSHFKQTCLSKTALTVAVLMLSLAARAGSSGAVEKAVDEVPSETQLSQERMSGASEQGSAFPRWPQRQQENRKIIPPPPPGPYSSSALSDHSVPVPPSVYHAARSGSHRSTNNAAATPVPMETFSPDIPWPTNLRPERRQLNHRGSEQGLHPVKPLYGPMTKTNNGNYNYGNRSVSRRNNTGMNASRWMPGMTMTPPGPYNNRLNYVPNYGSYYGPQYGSRYGGPVINNNAMRSANPASR